MPVKRGVAVWIFGFITFLAALSSFATVLYWIQNGQNFLIQPYLVGDYIGQLRVIEYFWIFIIITFVFLGVTCLIAYRNLPPDPEIVKLIVKTGGNIAALRENNSANATWLAEKIDENSKTRIQFFMRAEKNLQDFKEEMLSTLENFGRTIRKSRREIVSEVGPKLDQLRNETRTTIGQYKGTMDEVKRLGKQGIVTARKQEKELKAMKLRLEKLEAELMPPAPRLKSADNPEELKGVGPSLGKELTSLGIRNVGELIMANPSVINQKTRVSKEMAERLHAMAQLLMVPGVDETDAELLLEAGVNSRRRLASQDLVKLSRRIGEIAEIYVEQGKLTEAERPTIEEISAWIKLA